MKRTAMLLVLLTFIFGSASAVENYEGEKWYQFDYIFEGGQTEPVWYQEVKLYVDGELTAIFNIGNDPTMDIADHFTVPVGHSWELVQGRCIAMIGDHAVYCSVDLSKKSGTAGNIEEEIIGVIVR